MAVPQISVVVPCYNEADNIKPLVTALDRVLKSLSWEVIFVDDDSLDGTIGVVRALAARDGRVRGIRRVGRRGLSSAVIEGVMSSSAPVVVVMDGDLQHDESCLPGMIGAILDGAYDLAVASRYVKGGKNGGLSNSWRRFLSSGGIMLARKLLSVPLSDPMSGFFAIRRSCFDERVAFLGGKGFKILLDLILARPEPLRLCEVPMVFRNRKHGESKLGTGAMMSFARMIVQKTALRHTFMFVKGVAMASLLAGGAAVFCSYRKNH